MAKITSKASLNVGTELTIDEPTRVITLNAAGNLAPQVPQRRRLQGAGRAGNQAG